MKYLINGPVTPEHITEKIKKLGEKKDSGGHSFFLGQVRDDEAEGRRVKAIEYFAYEGMVNAEVQKIRKIVLDEFDDVNSITVLHSTGIVKAGELSLLVLVSAGHRDHAVRACRLTVELIKEKLPVWKKEIFEDNSYNWQKNESSSDKP